MWWCIFATPAMRLAPPIMQLRQADALSAGAGLAAGRAAPMMAFEQQGHSAAPVTPKHEQAEPIAPHVPTTETLLALQPILVASATQWLHG